MEINTGFLLENSTTFAIIGIILYFLFKNNILLTRSQFERAIAELAEKQKKEIVSITESFEMKYFSKEMLYALFKTKDDCSETRHSWAKVLKDEFADKEFVLNMKDDINEIKEQNKKILENQMRSIL